jgi:hypothetical protein
MDLMGVEERSRPPLKGSGLRLEEVPEKVLIEFKEKYGVDFSEFKYIRLTKHVSPPWPGN